MKHTVSIFLISTIFLAGCQSATPVQEDTTTSSSSAMSIATSSAQYIHWKTYQDAKLGINIDYPSDEYSVSLYNDTIQLAGDNHISVEGIRIGDNIPEGDSVHVYRTKDARILAYLQADKPFTGKRTLHNVMYNQFQFIGMGDVYGYVTKKNDYYYVFLSMWGPNNPVSEKMLQSLSFGS